MGWGAIVNVIKKAAKIVIPIAATALGLEAAEAVIETAIAPTDVSIRIPQPSAVVAAPGGGFVPIPVGQEVTQLAPGGLAGRGNVITRTIVERVDPRTMQLLSRQTLRGSPFLMNRDVASLRKTIGKIRRLEKRLPKRTAKISEKRLDDRVHQIAHTAQAFDHAHRGKC